MSHSASNGGFFRVTDSTKTVLIAEEKFVIEKDENGNEREVGVDKHNFNKTTSINNKVTNNR
jgi:hypothetical protein